MTSINSQRGSIVAALAMTASFLAIIAGVLYFLYVEGYLEVRLNLGANSYDYRTHGEEINRLARQLTVEPCDISKAKRIADLLFKEGDYRRVISASSEYLQACDDQQLDLLHSKYQSHQPF